MKYADPLIDLEETVRRGYNDPYNDRNFFMNKINEEYFQQRTPTQGIGGTEKALNPGSLTRQEIQRNAHVYDLTPQRIISESSSRTDRIPTSSKRIVQSRFPLHVAPAIQEQAGKNTGIPRSPDLLDNNILSLLKEFGMKTYVQAGEADPIKNFVKKQPERSDRVNPLTGLPENIEDKAYGAVTSIESVGDDLLPKPPQSVVVNLKTTADATQEGLAAVRQAITNKDNQMKPKSPSNMSNLMAESLGGNFDSIKSFLQADEILRRKMSNGL